MTPVALTIAGSDSGGGAGIQADLKTFQAFSVFGTSAITAITAQNTLGVTHVHAVPAEIVRAQIDAVVSDLQPRACKTGMLATAELVQVVAAALDEKRIRDYVLDPVMVATSGDRLLELRAEEAIIAELVPLATLVTPNLDEASLLTGLDLQNENDMRAAAEQLVHAGARAALVKGGHLPQSDFVIDVLFDGERFHRWQRVRVPTRSTHGTGCTLSAGITAGLALGWPLIAAVESALQFVHDALLTAPGLGHGHGPLNHMLVVRR